MHVRAYLVGTLVSFEFCRNESAQPGSILKRSRRRGGALRLLTPSVACDSGSADTLPEAVRHFPLVEVRRIFVECGYKQESARKMTTGYVNNGMLPCRQPTAAQMAAVLRSLLPHRRRHTRHLPLLRQALAPLE